jgi:hypothetical protein
MHYPILSAPNDAGPGKNGAVVVGVKAALRPLELKKFVAE